MGVGGCSALEIDYGFKCNFFFGSGQAEQTTTECEAVKEVGELRVWKLKVEEERSGDDSE